MPQLTATIIGGGIGGLATALTLRRVGIDVTVYERAELSSEAGAGFTLWSDALRILDDLGLSAAIEEHGVVVEESRICGPDGVPYPDVSLGSFVDGNGGAPPICIHRSVFQQLLLQALGGDAIVHGWEAIDIDPGDEQRPGTVQFSNGQSVSADVTVAADGIKSVIRAALFPDVRPVYNGQTIYRGVTDTPASAANRVPFVAISEGMRFGWVPLPKHRMYWFAGRYQPEHEPEPAEGRQAFLLDAYGGWADPVTDLIATTPPDRILRNDVYTVGPLEAWSRGRVALLGDSAHAVPPHVGHGACLAIEDAAALADALAPTEAEGVPAALGVYADRRADRTTAIFNQGAQIGSGLQAGNIREPQNRS